MEELGCIGLETSTVWCHREMLMKPFVGSGPLGVKPHGANGVMTDLIRSVQMLWL